MGDIRRHGETQGDMVWDMLLQAHGGPPLLRRGSAVRLRGLQSRQEL